MTDFTKTRAMFHLPEGLIYLDGNSLGPLPKAVPAAVEGLLLDEWGQELIRSWNSKNWFTRSAALGDRIGKLIGAPAGTTMIGDTLSIKVFQALAACLHMVPDRRVILSDTGNFPTDLYMAEGLIRIKDNGYRLKTVPPESVLEAIDDTVAVVMVTEVDYRTSRRHDMAAIIEKAHAAGARVVWDLAHSAGAVEVDVLAFDTDFAVGCTYKYLNAGPGAPAFIYVAPRHLETAEPALSGWHGHSSPFAFDLSYHPAASIERMRIGTPAVMYFPVISAAMDIWDMTSMAEVRAESIRLSEIFIAEIEGRCPQLQLASPRDPQRRGSQVSFRFTHGYSCMQALIDRGLIGDFRAPDIMRFGIAPLFNSETDIRRAVDIIEDVLNRELWKSAVYQTRSVVT